MSDQHPRPETDGPAGQQDLPPGSPPQLPSAPHAPPRRTGLIVATVAAVLMVLAGTTATVLLLDHWADVAAQARETEEERSDEEEAAALAEARDVYKACTDQLDQLMTSLSNIDARLDVGLSLSELADMLGKASIAYNRINIESLGDGNCLTAGVKLEHAFYWYNATVGPWEDCIYDHDCDLEAHVLPGLQQTWAQASGLINEAETHLATLDPDGATYEEAAEGDPI